MDADTQFALYCCIECIITRAVCCCSVFSSQASPDESSSDEGSSQCSPAVRKRRPRKRGVSSSEPEAPAGPEAEPPQEEQHKRQFSSGLNRCIILALVIAISMGFGHFYGEFSESRMRTAHILRSKRCFVGTLMFFLVLC